jgi:single-stranded-DNA-specific exonuclease
MAEIKNLKKAAQRIKKAVKNKEKIVLYGDSDLDGMASVIILKESIRNLGGEISAVYFPDRESEGYGLNEAALDYLKPQAPALLIVMDCGIGNFTEVKLAKKLGFEVLILDHHKPLGKLPQASIVVNLWQKGDKYPFKEFAAAGLIFKLSEELLAGKNSNSLRNNLLELAGLATLADMMPQIEDNLAIISEGLISLAKTSRPGLKVFYKISNFEEQKQIFQRIISACHAGDTKDHINEGYLLLTETSSVKAEELAKSLLERAILRQQLVREITLQAEAKILDNLHEPLVFQGDPSWPVLMLGPVASRLVQNYQKPIFLYSQKNSHCQGAVRTPKGVDGVKAMQHCAKLLDTYGGHPQAAGFKVLNKNLEKFKECLIQYFKKL